jgi:hypothetical protein
LDALARGIDTALANSKPEMLRALLSLKDLPADLEGLYGFFLHQIKATVSRQRIELQDEKGETYDKAAWPAVYSQILGVLTVAMEPLDLELIERLAGIRAARSWLNDAMEHLVQFLDVHNNRYRFYHSTVAEFLISERTKNNPDTVDLHQAPSQWHFRIAMSYWNAHAGDWRGCDRYGLRHVANHLFEASDTDRLRQLISPERQAENTWYTAKAMVGDLDGWEADVELALRLAEKNEAVDLQVRYALCLSSGRSIEAPAALLDLCVVEGVLDWPQALSQARLHQNPAIRAEVISRLAPILPDCERERVVEEEFEAASRIQDDRLRVAVWVALARYLPERRVGDVLSLAKRLDEEKSTSKGDRGVRATHVRRMCWNRTGPCRINL